MLYSWPALNSWPVKAEGVKYDEFDDWNYVYTAAKCMAASNTYTL